MADLLVVAGEALWPADHGGRIRTARLAQALTAHWDVCVAAPPGGAPPPGLGFVALPPDDPPGRLGATVSLSPRLGLELLSRRRKAALAGVIHRLRPAAVLFAHSYLAAVASPLEAPVAVDFCDVEVRRWASFTRRGSARQRALAALEWSKARYWEPRMARRADLVLAVTPSDGQLLTSWGGSTVLVPHGADPGDYRPSPAEGPITFVASFNYLPNADAARYLLRRVWPRIQAEAPGIRLRLVGRAAGAMLDQCGRPAGVEAVSHPPSTEPFHRDASVVVAPVRMGGGAQVKVAEALSRGRLIVATPYSARSVPATASVGVVTAGSAEAFAAEVVRWWRDRSGRWAREAALVQRRPIPAWEDVSEPVTSALERILDRWRPPRVST